MRISRQSSTFYQASSSNHRLTSPSASDNVGNQNNLLIIKADDVNPALSFPSSRTVDDKSRSKSRSQTFSIDETGRGEDDLHSTHREITQDVSAETMVLLSCLMRVWP